MFTCAACAIDIGTSETHREQELESWGTSLAWWANGVGGWIDQQAKADLVGRMFDQANGLGLNYARYNIGGGQNRLYAGNFRPGALVPGWVPAAPSDVQDTATWQWDWNADPRQRAILTDAIAHGVNRVDAISYSAPYWMTNSQDSAGGVDGASNLPQAHVDELAHYQSEVVKHFYENLGVQFQAYSPINEADVFYWEAGGRQEGMRVAAGFDQRLVLEAVGEALQAKGVPVGISTPEELNASKTAASFNQYNSYTKSFITQINTHVYGGQSTSSLNQVRSIAAAEGIRLYQSEYGNNSTTGLDGGIGLANRITQDINVMGVNGWAYWQVVEPTSLSGAGWGLAWAGYGQTDSDFVIRKQYHVMRQFSANIRPGSHILDTTDADTVAAYDPITDTTTLVITNDSTQATSKSYTLLDGNPAFSREIQTAITTNYASGGPADVSGSNVSANVPGLSVTTILLHNRPNLVQNAGFDFDGEPSMAPSLSGGWQASGSASFVDTQDHTGDGSGVAVLSTDNAGNNGAIWQTGLGDAATDLTGVAYQLSLDAFFQAGGASEYDAQTRLGLEFYGADGATLAHTDVLDYATLIAPSLEDSQWRTFRTPIVMAPAGTRYVRPVVSFDDVGAGSTNEVLLDNVYLQEVNFRPRGREWRKDGNGSLSDDENWRYDASVAENAHLYFGPVLSQARTLSVGEDTTISGITFDSTHTYRLAGLGKLLFATETGQSAHIDVRGGNHIIQNQAELQADATLQLLSDASLNLTSVTDLNGYALSVQGPGEVSFTGSITLDGGQLQVYAKPAATVTLGANSNLNGTLDVLLSPGESPMQGDAYELINYTGAAVAFDTITLPQLTAGLAWEVEYLPNSLIASVVLAGLPGDYNEDGLVDAADYTLWRDNLGQPAGTLANDTDGGSIGTAQYATWKANYGNSLGPGSGESVPEPASLAVLLVASAIGYRRVRSFTLRG